ncbi:MAG: TonB-dependent receptor plug domain-containing protein [Asticcacaulis sp.]
MITAEDIGKFPDKNVADSLARATGVNVVTGSANAGGFGENERISIRGTDPELNLTLIGWPQHGDRRLVCTRSIERRPFLQLRHAAVRSGRHRRSDQIGFRRSVEGGVGGVVDVHVRKPLDLPANTFAASAQGMYATLPDKWQPNVSGMYSWKNDAHNFGILVGAFYEARQFPPRRPGNPRLQRHRQLRRHGPDHDGAVADRLGLLPAEARSQGRQLHGAVEALRFAGIRLLGPLHPSRRQQHQLELHDVGFATRWHDADRLHPPPSTPPTARPTSTSASWAPVAGQNSIVQDDIFRTAHSDSYDPQPRHDLAADRQADGQGPGRLYAWRRRHRRHGGLGNLLAGHGRQLQAGQGYRRFLPQPAVDSSVVPSTTTIAGRGVARSRRRIANPTPSSTSTTAWVMVSSRTSCSVRGRPAISTKSSTMPMPGPATVPTTVRPISVSAPFMTAA